MLLIVLRPTGPNLRVTTVLGQDGAGQTQVDNFVAFEAFAFGAFGAFGALA